eukprot:5899268-Pleurochrysis_carterae.AAC.2
MKDVNAFMSDLLGFKQKIDEGAVPKANFKAIRPLLAKEYFNVETMRNKSNAAAGESRALDTPRDFNTCIQRFPAPCACAPWPFDVRVRIAYNATTCPPR